MTSSDDALARALRAAVPPTVDTAPSRDLWPELALRIASPGAPRSRVDWILGGLAALWLLAFPRALGGLLYLL
jgi:hypothetical protein